VISKSKIYSLNGITGINNPKYITVFLILIVLIPASLFLGLKKDMGLYIIVFFAVIPLIWFLIKNPKYWLFLIIVSLPYYFRNSEKGVSV
jgi:hypothetical protein